MAELGLREALLACATKTQFQRIISEKLRFKNIQDILEICKTYRKANYFELREEDFGVNESVKAMTLSESRTLFSIKFSMHTVSKLNYASDPINVKQSFLCQCGEISSNIHFLYCKKFEFLRLQKDISSDKGLVRYLQEILKFRV